MLSLIKLKSTYFICNGMKTKRYVQGNRIKNCMVCKSNNW